MIKKAGLIGCLLLFASGKTNAASYSYVWHISDLLKADTEIIHLATDDGKSLKEVERKQLIYLYSVMKAMEEVAETGASLFIIDGGEHPNAFAGQTEKTSAEEIKLSYGKRRGKKTAYIPGKKNVHSSSRATSTGKLWLFNYILINFKMLDMFGTDIHMMAALIGHELAHLRLDHGAEHWNKLPRHEQDVDSARYRRDNEREADYLGIIWAVEAGYDPEGAVRLRDNPIRKKSACRGYCISHPLSVERIIKSKALARRLSRDN